MDFDDAKWIVGIFLTLAALVIGAFYRLVAKMSKQHRDIYMKIDKIKDDYVRRDDFQTHMDRQGEKIGASILKMDEKIDRLIARK